MMVQGFGSRQGCVPGFPFARVINEWVTRNMPEEENEIAVAPMSVLAELMGMDINNLRKIRNGKREWIGFDLADKIVAVCTDGLGWRNDPQLASIYEHFDFGWLDSRKPCAA